jgi:hypothetical protein
MQLATKHKGALAFMMGLFAIWGLYLIWGLSTHRGFVGWMERLAIRQFGSADTNLILIVGMLVGLVASIIIMAPLAAVLGRGKAPPPFVPAAATRRGSPRARAWLIAFGILAATAVAEFFVLPRSGEPGRIIDLDGPAGPDPSDGERVQVTGTPQPKLAVGYQEKTGSTVMHHRFTPITPRGTRADDPVRFFQEQELEDGHAETIPIFHRDGSVSDGRVTVTGTAHANALPTLVTATLSTAKRRA